MASEKKMKQMSHIALKLSYTLFSTTSHAILAALSKNANQKLVSMKAAGKLELSPHMG